MWTELTRLIASMRLPRLYQAMGTRSREPAFAFVCLSVLFSETRWRPERGRLVAELNNDREREREREREINNVEFVASRMFDNNCFVHCRLKWCGLTTELSSGFN